MTITALETVLSVLHDHGIVNEIELDAVFAELLDTGRPPTRDQLGRIFGVAPIFHLLTIPDETARQLVREAIDILTNPESTVDLRDWVRAARQLVGTK